MAEPSSGVEPVEGRHEARDVQLRPLILCGIGLVVVAGMVLVGMLWLFDYLATRQAELAPPPPPLLAPAQLPPEPHLQTSPQRDLRGMRGAEDSVLQSYGWIDRQAGIVRIPISHAIELLAERAEEGQ